MSEQTKSKAGWKVRLIVYGGLLMALLFGAPHFVRSVLYPGSNQIVPETAPDGFTTVSIPNGEQNVHGWFAPGEIEKPVLIFFNGNAQNVQDLNITFFLNRITDQGLGLLVMDYPGYGRTPGKPSEASILKAASASMDWLLANHGERRKVIMGWSLGAAVAAQMAREYEGTYDGLILISPWTSLADVAKTHYPSWMVKLLVKESYDSLQALEGLKTPNLVVHGKHDAIIPVEQGRLVSKALSQGTPTTLVELGTAEHNDIFWSKNFWRQFARLLKMIPTDE